MSSLTVLVLLFSFSAMARNHVALLGGGGEPAGAKTIFDGDIPRFGKYVSSSPDISLQLSFNGGHSRTENKLSETFPQNPNTSFTPDSFKALIAQYETDIQSGKITSADQLMIFINTHGGEGQPGQRTHNIATSGGAIASYDSIEGPKSISLDRLQSLATLAESKGIRLAIIDVSCHSGASLPLANSKTCVISATGPNLYGYAGSRTFSSHLMNQMRPGKNLEEIFHAARGSSSHTDFPMISSGAGKVVQDEIYALLSQFLYSFDSGGPSKLQADIVRSVTTNSCDQENENLSRLISLLNDVEVATSENFRRLKEYVTEYQSLRQNVQSQLRGVVNHPALLESRRFCEGGGCISYSGKEVISMDIDASIRVARLAGASAPSQAAFYRRWESTLEQLRPWKAQLLSNPTLASYPNFFKNYPGLERQSEKLAKKISREERRLYREMYQEKSKITQASNPCRDFQL